MIPSTVREIHDAYDSGKLTPVELTKQYFGRIDASKHNAFITLCKDRALAQAEAMTAELKNKHGGKVPRREKSLFGIPMGIKDVQVIDGVRTTAGSKMLDNYIPPYTATSVQKLENAGVITMGKLNMDEFAMGSSNENSAYGPVLHPTHPDRVPGGSSGGSGTAVAADLVFAATGTDTGGSIRLPASFCGIVGMKPTYGRISRYGLIAFASSLDQIGPMAKTVEDAALICQVMAGVDELDETSAEAPVEDWQKVVRDTAAAPSAEGLRVGVPKEYFIDGIEPEVKNAIEASINKLKAQGAAIVPISLPHTKYAVSTYYVIAVSEASSNLSRMDGVRFGVRPPAALEAKTPADFYKKVRANFGLEVKRRIILGTFALSSGYYDAYYRRAAQVRRLMREDFEKAFQQCDVIVSPVAPMTAFKLGERSKNPLQMYLVDIFTIPASMAGLPAMSVPIAKDAGGLSIGMHLIASRFKESTLFKAAALVEGGVK
ncbi:MAG: Asp-tRNA(Asn)/Glu-tRNA(Gln) amidotransferase subunit GatA [Bdellovibrionales bacterium]|nr:Asp-tRNA(Asn)/Glu-tRNA(Gln) amidotransferase subunit GatA [Bdellovibrionales bacterium]